MHVFIVSYYFPPLGLAGTLRPLSLANYCAAQGMDVAVVTVKDISYPIHDESMQAQLDPWVRVYRVGSHDPARLQKFLPFNPLKKLLRRSMQQIMRTMIFPDSKVGFARYAIQQVKELLTDVPRAILVTTSPPISAHLVGLECANDPKVFWVADFRDIWTSLPLPDDNSAFTLRAESLLRDIASKAALITATSPKTQETLAQKYSVRDKVMFLPNGYAEEDFKSEVDSKPGQIGFFGTINDLVGFERVTNWLGEFLRSNKSDGLKLNHIGYLDLPQMSELLKDADLQGRFESTGYLPHSQAVTEIRKNDINLIALSDKRDTSYVIPSKLWEMLRAEPPLVAILPKGNAARRFLEERRFEGVWVTDSRSAFVATIDEILSNPAKYRGLRSPDSLREFEWQSEFERLFRRVRELSS